MKISIIGPVYPYRGGIAHYNALLARSLEKDHEIQMISFSRQYPSFLYPGVTDRDPSQERIEFPAKYVLDPLFPWTWFVALNQIYQFEPDIVVIHWWTTFWGVCDALLINQLISHHIRVVYIIHNIFPHEPRFWDKCFARWGLNHADRYILQTKYEINRLKALVPSGKTILIPHPVYAMFSHQITSRDEALRYLKLPADRYILLFFGIVRPYKGLKYLIEAISILKQRRYDPVLVIAGEFWEDESLYRSQIKHLDIEDQIIIINHYIPNEEIGMYFSAAHILIAPYIDATQSGAVKMAMGFHIPIVITDVLAQDDSISVGPTCLVSLSKDSNSLANTIQEMLDHYPSMSFQQATEMSSWQDLCKAITNI
jgi:glycosyltransferase involved in cell wall biosynthesis